MRRADDLRRVPLPGGFVDDAGRVHVDVDLGPLTGAGEETLLNAPPDTCAAVLTSTLLLNTIRRIGTVRRITAEVIRALLVQDRDFLVVRLREITLGREMWVRLQCPRAECGSEMELRLALDELPIERRPVTGRYFPFDDRSEFRLPTGGDQEWAASSGLSGEEMCRGILQRCVRDRVTHRRLPVAAFDEPLVEHIEQQMRELAPDVTPELSAICPECRTEFDTEVDMTYLVLRELKSATRPLEEEVHMLAWHYHWPEAEILALTRQKRSRYIRLIQDQLEAGSAV
jgi:hypothetical protein